MTKVAKLVAKSVCIEQAVLLHCQCVEDTEKGRGRGVEKHERKDCEKKNSSRNKNKESFLLKKDTTEKQK